MKATLIAITAALLMSPAAQANTLLYSWETQSEIDAWSGTVSQDSTGVTHGESSLRAEFQIDGASGWRSMSASMQQAHFDALNEMGNIAISYTIEDPGQNWIEMQIGVRMMGEYTEPGAESATFFDTGDPGPTFITGLVTGTTYELLWDDFDFGAPAGSTTNWGTIQLLFNPAPHSFWTDEGVVYLDNMRVIPEPASAGLLAMGGLALLARRRRTARQ
ncbi:MAG: PEP-CTERM sorting domain-containing protein [Phycisphaeraceae bacterium]